MTSSFNYHSDDQADRQNRWIHFLLFAAAILLFFGGIYELFLFATDWNHDPEDHSWWYLVFGLIYLTAAALLTYAGIRHARSYQHPTERYVNIKDQRLIWRLTQNGDVETILLADIQAVTRPNIRELHILLRDGSISRLPIYLVTDEGKQDELFKVLQERPVG